MRLKTDKQRERGMRELRDRLLDEALAATEHVRGYREACEGLNAPTPEPYEQLARGAAMLADAFDTIDGSVRYRLDGDA